MSGWQRVSSGKFPLSWFRLFDIPKFAIHTKSAGAELAATSRSTLGWVILPLVVLHAGAALHHQFRLKNGLLLRVLPTSQ